MKNNNVFDFIIFDEIPVDQRGTAIPTHMFLQWKFEANGVSKI